MKNWVAIAHNSKEPATEIYYIDYDASLEEAILSVYKYIRRADAHIINQVVTYEDDNVFLGWNESAVASVYIKDSLGYVYDVFRYL